MWSDSSIAIYKRKGINIKNTNNNNNTIIEQYYGCYSRGERMSRTIIIYNVISSLYYCIKHKNVVGGTHVCARSAIILKI